MDFFACTRIAFTAELSVSDLFLKTVHGGHGSECIRRRCELFLASHFSTSWERNSRKAVLPRHATTPSFGLLDFCFGLLPSSSLVLAASALLASASAPSSVRRGLGRRSIRAPFWRGACARAPGYSSRSVGARTLNSAATCALGVPRLINRRRRSSRSVALAFHVGTWMARVRD